MFPELGEDGTQQSVDAEEDYLSEEVYLCCLCLRRSVCALRVLCVCLVWCVIASVLVGCVESAVGNVLYVCMCVRRTLCGECCG